MPLRIQLNTPFGVITPFQVFGFYDKPVLFASVIGGTIYLAVLTEDGEETVTWLFVSVSVNRYQRIRTGIIDLYDAFMGAETGIAYAVTVDQQTDMVLSVTPRLWTDLADDELPMRGEYLMNGADQP